MTVGLLLVIVVASCSDGDVSSTTSITPTTSAAKESPGTTAAPVPSAPEPSGPAVSVDALGRAWVVGDCVLVGASDALPYEPYGEDVVVSCDEPHVYEVFFVGAFDSGPEDAFPADSSQTINEVCATAFLAFAGLHLSQSALAVVMYLPDEAEWTSGLRYQACMASDPRQGPAATITGSLALASPPLELTPGMCIPTGELRSDPVSCAVPHLVEVVGHATLDGPYPGLAGVRAAADGGCFEVAVAHVSADAPHADRIVSRSFGTLTEVEWNDGLRNVPCGAFVPGSDGVAVPVVGSFSSMDWAVLEDGITA